MEGAYCAESGDLLKFAEQQLVDCVTLSLGCHGGNPSSAMSYLKKHYEMYEDSYPYMAKNGHCVYDKENNSGVMCTSHSSIKSKDVEEMKLALEQGVISVAIQANKAVFQNYSEGIFDDDSCGGLNLDHAVNLVGWGIDIIDETEYWILRNSWNTSWGENGYMRLKIEEGKGICGVNKQPMQAFAAKV